MFAGDLYHLMLDLTWWKLLIGLCVFFFVQHIIFAGLYMIGPFIIPCPSFALQLHAIASLCPLSCLFGKSSKPHDGVLSESDSHGKSHRSKSDLSSLSISLFHAVTHLFCILDRHGLEGEEVGDDLSIVDFWTCFFFSVQTMQTIGKPHLLLVLLS